MSEQSNPALTVSTILGHSRSSTTLDIYGHSLPGADIEAIKRLSDALI